MLVTFAAILAFAACTDNASSDNSQDNTATSQPANDSSPSVENTGATNPNTVNSVGNQGSGADSMKGSTHRSANRADSLINGSAINKDTVIHNKPKK